MNSFFLPSPPNSNFFPSTTENLFDYNLPLPKRNFPQPRRRGGGGRLRLQGFVDLVTSRTFDFVKKGKDTAPSG